MPDDISQSSVESLIADAKKEVRKEVISKFTKYFIAGIIGIGALAVIGAWALLLPWITSITGGAPKGAVIAMDRSDLTADKCPSGWEPFLHARGRVIIGAGDPSKAPLKFGVGLSEYALREHGGYENVELTLNHLPEHNHDSTTLVDVFDGLDSTTTESGDMEQRSTRTGLTGKGKAHENRPPYIALFYCKKT